MALFGLFLLMDNYGLVIMISLVLGFCMLPGISVGLEFACELGYPIVEAPLTAFTFSAGQFASCILVSLFCLFQNSDFI